MDAGSVTQTPTSPPTPALARRLAADLEELILGPWRDVVYDAVDKVLTASGIDCEDGTRDEFGQSWLSVAGAVDGIRDIVDHLENGTASTDELLFVRALLKYVHDSMPGSSAPESARRFLERICIDAGGEMTGPLLDAASRCLSAFLGNVSVAYGLLQQAELLMQAAAAAVPGHPEDHPLLRSVKESADRLASAARDVAQLHQRTTGAPALGGDVVAMVAEIDRGRSAEWDGLVGMLHAFVDTAHAGAYNSFPARMTIGNQAVSLSRSVITPTFRWLEQSMSSFDAGDWDTIRAPLIRETRNAIVAVIEAAGELSASTAQLVDQLLIKIPELEEDDKVLESYATRLSTRMEQMLGARAAADSGDAQRHDGGWQKHHNVGAVGGGSVQLLVPYVQVPAQPGSISDVGAVRSLGAEDEATTLAHDTGWSPRPQWNILLETIGRISDAFTVVAADAAAMVREEPCVAIHDAHTAIHDQLQHRDVLTAWLEEYLRHPSVNLRDKLVHHATSYSLVMGRDALALIENITGVCSGSARRAPAAQRFAHLWEHARQLCDDTWTALHVTNRFRASLGVAADHDISALAKLLDHERTQVRASYPKPTSPAPGRASTRSTNHARTPVARRRK